MSLSPVVLLVPSMAAAVELPRRLASTGRALCGLYAFKLLDLARALAEPALLGRGHEPWDSGHDALLAARLLAGLEGSPLSSDRPRGPVAQALARTLVELRAAEIAPEALEALAARAGGEQDGARLRALAALLSGFQQARRGRVADPVTLFEAAAAQAGAAAWLRDAQLLVVSELELDPAERRFLLALRDAFQVRMLESPRPAGLAAGCFGAWARASGLRSLAWSETPLAPIAPLAPPAALARLRQSLFEPLQAEPVEDGSVTLLTAPGEAAEARAIARRLLAEAARGVPFEEMGVVLPRPSDYAPLFSDLFERLGIPHRLHPSLPLRFGRTARSLLLLFRCRGLERAAVMEFLTFARVPFEALLGEGVEPRPAQWDAISRDAGIVSGLERWNSGLRAHAKAEREGAALEEQEGRRERRLRRARDAEALLRVVERVAATLEGLAGEASWPDWSERLRRVLEQWTAPERDRDAVLELIADLGGLGAVSPRAGWEEVEAVVEARCEWERLPLDPVSGGAVHVGALDAMAGLPFRVVAVPGLVEGGYPGVLRPDPFLLDPEREALVAAPVAPGRRQLSLFDAPAPAGAALRTTQDRALEARRLFHRALSQATERLILSYPRADARSGRERLPSLFFMAAASTLRGRPVGVAELVTLVVEDAPDALPLEAALDASERDRARVRVGGRAAAEAVAAGSSFFRQSRLAGEARWSNRLTPFDGLVSPLPPELQQRLDPVSGTVSASRLATYTRCGFQYFLQYVLRLEPTLEPEERRRLEPLERGNLFHQVAERFLRERRDRGELPVQDTRATRARLLALAEEALDGLVAGGPPRFTLLWLKERARFRDSMLAWLGREAEQTKRATPAFFEVGFGLPPPPGSREPHSREPVELPLADGRVLRVSGKIDRIDRREDGGLVLRDYKTGRAPLRDEGGLFKGGKQLQIPFYVLAAAKLFPDAPVVEAFLDYVDAGRRVSLDPEAVRGDGFRSLLESLLGQIAQGSFVQEPAACEWCDFTAVCGPKPLLELRRRYKLADGRVRAYLRLRDLG